MTKWMKESGRTKVEESKVAEIVEYIVDEFENNLMDKLYEFDDELTEIIENETAVYDKASQSKIKEALGKYIKDHPNSTIAKFKHL